MRIFYDVDTQNDFMNKDGALYVPDAESIKSKIKLLTEFAENNKILIIGSVDQHFGNEKYKEREGELKKWGGIFPEHCMSGTFGQKKISETSTSRLIFHPHFVDNSIDYEIFNTTLKENSNLFFEKQSYNVFTNPAISAFLEKANVKESIVYGVATDYCVKAAVLGMQQKGIQCYVVEDAIKGVFPESTKSALEEMINSGARLVTTKQIIEGKI